MGINKLSKENVVLFIDSKGYSKKDIRRIFSNVHREIKIVSITKRNEKSKKAKI